MSKSCIKRQTPTNVRLGDIKAPLQKRAMELDRSLNWLICDILKKEDYVQNHLSSLKERQQSKKQFKI